MRRIIQQQEGTRGLGVCSYFRYRRSEDSEDKGTCEPRITVPAVSVDNYAGTFPGSQQNSHGIVNSQEGSGRGDENWATKRNQCKAPSISRINFTQS